MVEYNIKVVNRERNRAAIGGYQVNMENVVDALESLTRDGRRYRQAFISDSTTAYLLEDLGIARKKGDWYIVKDEKKRDDLLVQLLDRLY